MEKQAFETLVDTNKYQVFVCYSHAHFPFWFAKHPWVVVNNRGTLSRYGIAFTKHVQPIAAFGKLERQAQWGHLYRNYFPPWQGIRIFPFVWKLFWKGDMLGYVEGDDGSLAATMVAFIEGSPQTYPHIDTYRPLGPNSNTYVQWILDNFPECDIRLPWNAFGKHWANGNKI